MKTADQGVFPGKGGADRPSGLRKSLSGRFSGLLKLNIPVFLIFFAITASPALSATYYIDFSAGSNSNNGLSTSTPWKHSPGDPNATANAARTVLPGDVILFRGGVVYSGQINVNGGGNASSGITFLSGHLASPVWGTGRAIIDGGFSNKFGFFINGKSYVTIEGLEIRNIGAPTADAAGVMFANYSAAVEHNVVRNCVIHNINWQGTYVIGYGIEMDGGAYLLLEYNEIYNATDKLIETYGGATRGTNHSNHNTIRFNTLHNSAVHGIVLISDDDAVYGNIVYQVNDGTISNSPNPGFGLKVDQGSRNAVYNNIFYAVNAVLGVLVGDDNKFYSNTLYAIGTNGSGYHQSGDEAALVVYDDGTAPSWSAPRVMRNEFTNNVVYYMTGGSGQATPMFVYFKDDGGSGNKFLNNLFYKASGDSLSTTDRIRRRSGGSYFYSNVTDWQANFNNWEGGSNNVASGNIVSDPQFVGGLLGSVTSLPTGFSGPSPNANGLNLSPSSPAAAGGIVLGAPYDTDIRSVPRVSYSRGAYEVASQRSPLPPSNLQLGSDGQLERRRGQSSSLVSLRRVGPLSTIWCALWRSRLQMASASVGSPM